MKEFGLEKYLAPILGIGDGHYDYGGNGWGGQEKYGSHLYPGNFPCCSDCFNKSAADDRSPDGRAGIIRCFNHNFTIRGGVCDGHETYEEFKLQQVDEWFRAGCPAYGTDAP